ncbi:D-hexose-6-phosphate mutarotase [Cobetia sp. 14N.309.X.WAT.E.A4]|uniref:D-hexose-6-phosphate mutarotase n=1 Tax=Cobetia sp. 14N.309.X.WAT.E.A4 TaxID=2998323 RepID=UPI0025AFE5F3|nr:D-hexose-6-phosphate mutarotase [Cobetia sp. 14N.309.X.WAT.E.A4]MDN2656792.1 D-hexose-6-phosphate mutarotase [Cobetia sp. 14N.309.X.WAT.E.A4]
MIPESLRALVDATSGQRTCEWQGRMLLILNRAWGELVVCHQGAQVLHYQPASQRPWLWVTETPAALPGSIRGGIPLCWPWFADEYPEGETELHGPARKAEWRIDAVEEDEEEGVEIHASPQSPLHAALSPRVVIFAGRHFLKVELITENRGENPVKMTGALHTYFAVEDAFQCRVTGLAGASYLDKRQDFSRLDQQGELGIRGPLDRIYQSSQVQVLEDGQRRLRIAKQGSDSTVVWHPGDAPPADTSVENARSFLCVEAACTRLDPVWLPPGAQHLLVQHISPLEQEG